MLCGHFINFNKYGKFLTLLTSVLVALLVTLNLAFRVLWEQINEIAGSNICVFTA